jgi:adenine C2-methylase RlmN of 23S rRNA A2503 and tRNA A37
MRILNSSLDTSVNHVYEDGSEFRLVPREGYDTIYLSSHTGCGLGCRMCHLTATGQTKMIGLAPNDIVDRARAVLETARQAQRHYAFMSRGDALANPRINSALLQRLFMELPGRTKTRVSISTIFPWATAALEDTLQTRFDDPDASPSFYWSLYSLDSAVRAKWLPDAGDPEIVAPALRAWLRRSNRELVVHYAIIKGVNDSVRTAHDIRHFLVRHELDSFVRFNMVRYNPPTAESAEADEEAYQCHAEVFRSAFGAERVQIKKRVGYDVKASCGMFVDQGAQ